MSGRGTATGGNRPGSVAIITGATSGIGLETARLLAQEGWSLVLAGRRESVLLEVSAECLDLGAPVAVPVPCDLTVAEETQRLADAATSFVDGKGRAALVNSAGIASFGAFETSNLDDAVNQVDVNLTGLMRATHALLPILKQAESGHIMNVLSISATHTFGGAAAYCASKAGALMFGRCLAQEVRREGIRVTSLLPGSTDTPLWDKGDWKPPVEDMLSSRAVAEVIRDVLLSPLDRSYDEITLMPPKGIL